MYSPILKEDFLSTDTNGEYSDHIKYYTLKNITPLNSLCGKDKRGISIATERANLSTFQGAHAVGACLVHKGRCLQGRE